MERRLWSSIVSMLGLGDAAAVDSERASGGGDESASADGFERRQVEPGPHEFRTRLAFADRLHGVAAYGDAIAAGRVKLINFGRIKGDYGLKWPEVADRIGATISGILRRRLGPADSFLRLDDTNFVLLLDSKNAAQAQLVCSLIAAEIKQKLFGIDRDFSAVQLATSTVQLDGNVAFDPQDPIDTLTAMLDGAPVIVDRDAADAGRMPATERQRPQPGALVAAAVTPRIVPSAIQPNGLDNLLRTMSRSIGDWRQFIGPAEHKIYDGAQTQRQIAEGAKRQRTMRLFETAASGATVPMMEPDESERDFIMSQVKSASFRYLPIWHRGTQAITSYGLGMRFLVGDAYLSLSELMEWEDDPEIIVSVDLMIVKKGVADLAKMLRQGTKAILFLPLHRAVLDLPRARAELISMLSEVPMQMRKLILLDILDAYGGDWTVLPAMVAGLKRVSRDVVLRLSLDQTDFSRVLATGARAVSGDLRDHPWPQTRAIRALSVFAKAAHDGGFQCYVFGLNAPPLAGAAVAAGFDHLAGSAVAQETPEPLGVVPLDTASVSPMGEAAAG
ncbi:MAG: hypothetical protein ACOY3L_01160 [Pseudomonadota bacterium]